MDPRELFKRLKVCVLIPTYNNEQTLQKVITEVLTYTDQVIIVNDGSTDSTISILQNYSNLVHIVSYEKNRGKGNALRTGFRAAVDLGYDYAISIDSDGQHYASDLPSFLDKLQSEPNAIIIGARNMVQINVPGKSSFGNKFSNFWFDVETGYKMQDTQSGYRLYPVGRMKSLSFVTRKFEFEIEVLVRSAWDGIGIVHVPVKVFYPEKGKRITHFRPFKDFTRISILNTVLVTIAFLYIKPRDFFRSLKKNTAQVLRELLFDPAESDAVKALSVGFGVFMGIFPVWGFQLIIAITLSFVLKLNKTLVIIAANVSIFPPLIIYLSHWVGMIWMGKNAQRLSFDMDITITTVRQNFVQYVLGAVTLSILAGLFFGATAWLLLKIFKRTKT